MKNFTNVALILISIVLVLAAFGFAYLTTNENLLLTYFGEIFLSLSSIVFAGFAIGELTHRFLPFPKA